MNIDKTRVSANKYIEREKSWLAFNARVLQEAIDDTVPLLERFRFIGIFSNNLDEFFRVRYAAIRRLNLAGISGEKYLGGFSAQELLTEITEIVIKQQAESLEILTKIEQELAKENIFFVDETNIPKSQEAFLNEFFTQKLKPELITIILNEDIEIPALKDSSGYLAVKLLQKDTDKVLYSLIEIPKTINRFVVLPSDGEKQYIIMLDDLIRYKLKNIFNIFNYTTAVAHMIKITRDAQLEIDNDLSKSMLEKISTSVKERRIGVPVRFIYDKTIDDDTLKFLMKKMNIVSTDSIIPGGKYHNKRDYIDFPNINRPDLTYENKPALPVVGLSMEDSILERIKEKDYLLHTPYQNFSYLIKFMREVAIDPNVISIKITLYRLARNSQIISSLINAARNGKKVTVQIELQARFDEASNIYYSELMQQEGIELIFGIKGLKVHSKVCVVERLENGKNIKYGFVSTGNFNESTAKIYTDVTLFTCHQKILKDINKVFRFFNINYKVQNYKHLIVSPHNTRSRFAKLIDREIVHAQAGRETYIKLKMNSLSDFKMINKLYEASKAGVKIQLLIRGICCLIPKTKDLSENIEAISIVDNYLEHSRIYIFGNAGDASIYISSADLMTRNLDDRVEITAPIYDEEIKQELIEVFDIYWKGNVKARYHSEKLDNKYKEKGNAAIFRAQQETYKYYQNKIDNNK